MADSGAIVVVLFVRVPVPGRVKTRLAAELGGGFACRLYRAMVADILAQVRASGLALHLYHDGASADELPPEWTAGAAEVREQCEGDIGRRMAAAFAACFAAGIERVLLAGSDLPGLDAASLAIAAAALGTHDVVLVPAADGGYGLIGCTSARFRPEIFAGIPWSTEAVLAATSRQCAACGLTVRLLPTLRDIDTAADLLAYGQRPHPAAPATNRAIAELAGRPPKGG
ncbi:TIGR04282 family arsenosugar biosynthesis glycosyltransferase [Desulfobulbus sp.]|uniref:TIGR04282 family arsenosugar biosynthesis glycosyltransferase n=1 Tax=Desulfobulbus sp. TaxID=895 RepID=UPI00286EECF0|nr:TIGR04282 family arsenosugar biosynthesis glycosyltransferase [Desulfobulbus sp.]